MIGWIETGKRIYEYSFPDNLDIATIQNPVNVVPGFLAREFVKSGRMLTVKYFGKAIFPENRVGFAAMI